MKLENKKKLEDQNDFMRSLLRSLDDIKNGRVHRFRFTKKR